jgi:hypothetical protein
MRQLSIILVFFALGGCDTPVSADVDQGKNHKVRAGESLFSIAEQAYGNGLEWPRIWEANPWVDPDRLRPGVIIHIPAKDLAYGDPPADSRFSPRPTRLPLNPPNRQAGTRTSFDPGMGSALPTTGSGGIRLILKDLKKTIQERTVFGMTLDKGFLAILLCAILHTLLQTTLVWLTANITFVKEATYKKSFRAVVLTEALTLTTLVVLCVVGVLVVHLGASPDSGGTPLFPTLEGWLHSPLGLGLFALTILVLYTTLSLRFFPQVFGMPMSQAITLMTIAVLIPHLIGAYFVGQRTGILQ